MTVGDWPDPLLLAQLMASGIKVTVRQGEVTKQDVRIGGTF